MEILEEISLLWQILLEFYWVFYCRIPGSAPIQGLSVLFNLFLPIIKTNAAAKANTIAVAALASIPYIAAYGVHIKYYCYGFAA